MKQEDKLKQLVSQNRAAFDNKIPDQAVRDRIWERMDRKAGMKGKPGAERNTGTEGSGKKPVVRRLPWNRFQYVAASVAILVILGFVGLRWVFNDTGTTSDIKEIATLVVGQEPGPADESVPGGELNPTGELSPGDPNPAGKGTDEVAQTRRVAEVRPNPVLPVRTKIQGQDRENDQTALEKRIAALLETEESASRRMEGILEMASMPELPQELMDKLMHTINHDPNSNVRYAAIELLMNRLPAMQTGQAIQDVFIRQDDPTIQLDLMLAMAQHDTIRINEATADRLYAIANDPLTLDFVKDQAYAVLLKTW